MKQSLLGIIGLGVLALIIAWMAGTFHEKIRPSPPQAAEGPHAPANAPTAEIQKVVEKIHETVIGTVVAERKTAVPPKIMASIRSIAVSAGAEVKQGDILAVLDSRDLDARSRQAADAIDAAQAALNRAQLDYQRSKELLAQKVISETEFDLADAQYRIARAEVARARQAKQEADVALTYAVIRAPINGRVVDRLAEPGDITQPGQPILTLYDPSALRLEAPVRENLAAKLAIGDTLRVRLEALNLTVEGRLDEIVPEAQTASRSLLVKVGLPTQAGIYSGMFGRLFIPSGERERLCAPGNSIIRVGQLEYVTVLGENRMLGRRFVQTGERCENGKVEILSGVKEGEKVIVRN